MIGDRYAVDAHAVPAPARERRQSIWAARPATAGRERLAEALGKSPLVQLMLAMTCIAVAGLLYLAQASQVSVLSFSIADLQTQQTQLNSENAGFHATAVQLSSIQRIDSAATTRFHMSQPDLSSAIWIQPVIPRAAPVRALNADTIAAQQASQPLSWMHSFYHFVLSSL